MAEKKIKVNGEDFDRRAVSTVRRLAAELADGGVLQGNVPREVMEALYQHASAMVEVVRRELGTRPPPLAISVEKLPKKQLGHFKPGRDGLGLRWRVAMNILHLGRPRADVLATLLHETLHAVDYERTPEGEQQKLLRNPHHIGFRKMAERLGVPCDARGCSSPSWETLPDSPFARYVRSCGADKEPPLLSGRLVGKAAGSPLKKWSCGCTNIRVCTFLDATCNMCGRRFEVQE